MIEVNKYGVRIVDLGNNTTFISQAINKETKESCGIAFSNKKVEDKNFDGTEVIINIVNFNGARAYIHAILKLLGTWNEISEDDKKMISDTLEAVDKYK